MNGTVELFDGLYRIDPECPELTSANGRRGRTELEMDWVGLEVFGMAPMAHAGDG